jgi:hypothetical protein
LRSQPPIIATTTDQIVGQKCAYLWNKASVKMRDNFTNFAIHLLSSAIKKIRPQIRNLNIRRRHYDSDTQRLQAAEAVLAKLPEISSTTRFEEILNLKDQHGNSILFEKPSQRWDIIK